MDGRLLLGQKGVEVTLHEHSVKNEGAKMVLGSSG